MLCRETITLCSEIHTKHINTVCAQNVEFVNVKAGGTYSHHGALKGVNISPFRRSFPFRFQKLRLSAAERLVACVSVCLCVLRNVLRLAFCKYYWMRGRQSRYRKVDVKRETRLSLYSLCARFFISCQAAGFMKVKITKDKKGTAKGDGGWGSGIWGTCARHRLQWRLYRHSKHQLGFCAPPLFEQAQQSPYIFRDLGSVI